MERPLRLLLVEDCENDAVLLAAHLRHGGYELFMKRVEHPDALRESLLEHPWDVVISDYVLPFFNGLEALKIYQRSGLDIPFILLSGQIDEAVAADAMRQGAHDYIMKDNPTRLLNAIEREMREATLRREKREGEQRYRTLFETMAQGVIYQDAKGRMIAANPAALQILGVREDELIGLDRPLPRWETIHEDGTPVPFEEYASIQALRTGRPQPGRITGIRHLKDGPYHWVLVDATPLYRPGETTPFEVYTSLIDITERKQAEDALRRTTQEFQLLFENSADAILWADVKSGRIIQANRAAERLWEIPREKLVGLHQGDLHPPEDRAKMVQRFSKRSDLSRTNISARILSASGRRIPVEIISTRAVIEGTIIAQGIFRDISARVAAETALRESEEKYRALVENSPDVIMRFDRQGRHLYVSPSAETLTAIPRADWIGHSHRQLGFPEYMCDYWEQKIQSVLDTGKPQESEFVMERTGGPILFNWRLLPEYGPDGNISGVISVARDITAYRQAEQSYQALFEKMIEGFALHEILCDNEGRPVDYRFLTVNPAFERLTGLKAEVVVGRRVKEVLPHTEPVWIERYGQVALTGQPLHFEEYSQALGRYYEVSAYSPAPRQFACIFVDITERRQAEISVRESREYLNKIINSISDPLFAKDRQHRLCLANDALCRFIGKTREEMLGKMDFELYAREQAQIFWDKDEEVFSSGRENINEEFLTDSQGVLRTIITKKTLYIDSQGRPYLVGIISDISELKQHEVELEILTEQLRNLSTRLQSVKEEESKRISQIIHDELGQALTALKMDITWLAKNLGPEQPALQEKAQAMKTLIGETIKTVQHISRELRPSILDDLGLPTAMEWYSKEFMERTGLHCRLRCPPEGFSVPPSMADTLFRIYQEAMTNIARHAEASEVLIELKTEHEALLLRICDNGRGIPSEALTSAHSIGLIQMRERIRSHQGTLDIRTAPGQGTEIRLNLPLPPASLNN